MIRNKMVRLLVAAVLNLTLLPCVYAAVIVTNTDYYNRDHLADLSAYPPTEGIRTGLIKLGHSDTLIGPRSATINWGDGNTSSALMDCTVAPITNMVSCDYWGHQHIYPNRYTTYHDYTITVTTNTNNVYTRVLRVYPIGKFVIVSVGDSVASGEGNPVVPKNTTAGYSHPAYWDYGDSDDYSTETSSTGTTTVSKDGSANGCHGSSISGPEIAASQLRQDNPSTQITFIHLACSGARISGDASGTGDLGQYGDTITPDHVTGQLKHLENLLPAGTKIDVLLISVGANSIDKGFGTIINTCLAFDCSENPTNNPTVQDFQNHLANIPNLYFSPIVDLIHNGSLNISDENVYMTEYFDPTHDYNGQFPSSSFTNICTGGRITTSEWSYLHDKLLHPLNTKIQAVVANHGWNYVGEIATDFSTHGYCVEFPSVPGTSWVVHAGDSVTNQGDKAGASHPNSIGQKHYAKHIVDAINARTLPVTTATATAGGASYSFGTWAHGDVMVSLSGTNKLSSAGYHETKYSIDDADCSDVNTGTCKTYSNSFSVTAPGKHTIYFLSDNTKGNFEKVKTAHVMIDEPVSSDDSISTTTDQAASGQLQASNPNSSDTLTYNIVTQPSHGTVTLTDVNKGIFAYTPESGYIGNDSFTFMLNNGYVDSNIATESVTVAAAETSGSQPTSSGSGGSGTVGPMFLVVLALFRILLIQQRRVM